MPYRAHPGRAIPGEVTPGWGSEDTQVYVEISFSGTTANSGSITLESFFGLTLSGTTANSGSLTITLPHRSLVFSGSTTNSGSILFGVRRALVFSGSTANSGSIAFTALYIFVSPTISRASMSATIKEAASTTANPANDGILRLDGDTNELRALVFADHGIPIGVGASVIHADLYLFKKAAWTNGPTLTVTPLDGSWSSESVTWATKPALRASTATVVVASGGADQDEIVVDVTDLVAELVAAAEAAGTRDYGYELKISTAGQETVYSSQGDAAYRPYIKSEFSRPPDPPLDLLPSGDLVVSEVRPELVATFRDPDAEDTLTKISVEVSTDSTFATTNYASGAVSHTYPRFDMASPPTGSAAVSDLSVSTTYYWRMKVADNHGIWSDWSEAASFSIVAKSTLTMTAPSSSSVTSPTPTITWTFSGTQSAYEALIEEKIGGAWVTHYTTGKLLGTTLTATLPNAYALAENTDYRAVVRAWDNQDRADMSGDRAFVEDTQEFTLTTVAV